MPKPIQTVLNVGSSGIIIDIECQLSNGLPGITIVGLGNKAIDESRERVRSAFASCQVPLPRKRITINLAPADIPKESASLDLAIALSILQADSQMSRPMPEKTAVIGEMGLDGSIRPVRGVIGKILAGQSRGISRYIIPEGNTAQALLIPGISIIPVGTFKEILSTFVASQSSTLNQINTGDGQDTPMPDTAYEHQISHVVGQEHAKRSLEIAAAGGHNVFLNGPPGTGKSMLARALPSILPPPSREEVLEITQIHSLVSGNYDELVTTRPFRTPHHSASHIAVIGGGNNLRPGEISLAHRGVLFFDEFPEFGRATLEALRQPLEDRFVTISRAKETAKYPANFILIATANPCPCGYFGTSRDCTCTAHAVTKYRQKLSGPIMDRIDLYANVQEIEHGKLLAATSDRNDPNIRGRVMAARSLQLKRYGSPTKLNAYMTNQDIKTKSNLSDQAQALLNEAAKKLELSARSYMRTIKVARTIADLEKSEVIDAQHIGEALQYRNQSPRTFG